MADAAEEVSEVRRILSEMDPAVRQMGLLELMYFTTRQRMKREAYSGALGDRRVVLKCASIMVTFIVLHLLLTFLLAKYRPMPVHIVAGWYCMTLLLGGALIGFACLRDARHRALAKRLDPSACSRCEYDLKNAPEDNGWIICPECGRSAGSTSPARRSKANPLRSTRGVR